LEKEGRTSPAWGLVTSQSRKVEKRCGRMNMVQILYTHVCKWKMRPVKLFQKWEMGVIKENGGGGEFKCDVFNIL
jgi:hypothetical protein